MSQVAAHEVRAGDVILAWVGDTYAPTEVTAVELGNGDWLCFSFAELPPVTVPPEAEITRVDVPVSVLGAAADSQETPTLHSELPVAAGPSTCTECGEEWPCSTVRAL